MKSGNRRIIPLLVVAFFIYCNFCNSQNTFLKSYNTGDMGYCVREANGVSYVATGCTDFYYNFHWFNMSPIVNTNIQLLKTMTDGNFCFGRKYILILETEVWQHGWNIPQTMDTLLQVGRIRILSGHLTATILFYLRLMTMAIFNGLKNLWYRKRWSGYCVQQTSDGGYIISGFPYDSIPLSLEGTTYAILIKTDVSGNVIWEKKYEFAVRDLDTANHFHG